MVVGSGKVANIFCTLDFSSNSFSLWYTGGNVLYSVSVVTLVGIAPGTVLGIALLCSGSAQNLSDLGLHICQA